MKYLFSIIFFFVSCGLFSQSITRALKLHVPNLYYQSGNCSSFNKTIDSGFIIEYTYSYHDFVTSMNTTYSSLTKFDSLMVPLWSKPIMAENGRRIVSFADGSHLLMGSGTIMEKINNEGITLWNKEINNSSGEAFYSYNISLHNDTLYTFGKFNITSTGNPAVYKAGFVKLNSNGDFLSADTLSISNNSAVTIDEMILNDQGEKIIFGELNDTNDKVYIVKLDSQNNVLFSKQYLNPGFYYTYIEKAIQLSNGDFLLAGTTTLSNSQNPQYRKGFISRISQDGDPIWNKIINEERSISGIQELNNGNLLITDGNHLIWGLYENFYLELDIDGNIIRNKKQDLVTFFLSEAVELSDNQRCFLKFDQVPVLFDTDSIGNEICSNSSTTLTLSDFSWNIDYQSCQLNSMAPLSISSLGSYTKNQQEYLETCSYFMAEQKEFYGDENITIYPNPSTSNFMIHSDEPGFSIQIYTIDGEMINYFNTHEFDVEITIQTKGVYLIKVLDSKNVSIHKIIID